MISRVVRRLDLPPAVKPSISMGSIMQGAMMDLVPPEYAEMIFRTPISFRRHDRYVIFPEGGLIFASVLRRWNYFAPQLGFSEGELLPQLLSSADIRRYQLRSEEFHVERVRITGFSERLTLGLHGDELTQRLAALLIAYAAYAGVGIKTALGMGATETKFSFNQ